MPQLIRSVVDPGVLQVETLYTTRPGEASDMTRQAVEQGVKYVIAVGGDGTVNEVAQQLVHTHSVLGIVPNGSGNGLARHLGIPMSVPKALSLLNRPKVIKADYGLLNHTPFFCTAGIGFDAEVGMKFAQLNGRGLSNYLKTILLEYVNYKPTPYVLKVNGQRIDKEAFLITIANASQWGNNAFIAPHADVSDGLLNVTIMSPFPMILAPTIGIQLLTKQITHSHYVETFEVAHVEISRPGAGCVHVDGEPLNMGETLVADNQHLALNVIVG